MRSISQTSLSGGGPGGPLDTQAGMSTALSAARATPAAATLKPLLSLQEEQDLWRCESKIKEGLQTFREVGEALARIRDQRLYRVEFGTFQEYCQKRWNITARRGRQLMDASEVVRNLLAERSESSSEASGQSAVLPATESQARPLSRLPATEQPQAWQEAVEASGGKPTARDVEEAVQSRLPRESVERPERAKRPERGAAGASSVERGSANAGDGWEETTQRVREAQEKRLGKPENLSGTETLRLAIRETIAKVAALQKLLLWTRDATSLANVGLALTYLRTILRQHSQSSRPEVPEPPEIPRKRCRAGKAPAKIAPTGKAEHFLVCREGTKGSLRPKAYWTIRGGWTTDPNKAERFGSIKEANAVRHDWDKVVPLTKALRRFKYGL